MPTQIIPMHPRTAQVVQHLQSAVRAETTLELLVKNPIIQELANEEKLSKPQIGLIAATASIMQDTLIQQISAHADDLRRTLEAERFIFASMANSFASAFTNLYKIPFVGNAADSEPPKGLRSLLTWGNFFAAAALVLLAVSVLYTKAYSSYKDRAENQAAVIGELQSQITTARSEKESLVKELESVRELKSEADKGNDYYRALAEEREKQITQLTTKTEVTTEQAQTQIQTLTATAATLKAKNEEAQAQLRSGSENATTFKNLYYKERDKYDDLNKKFVRLNDENSKLRRKVSELENK